MLTSSTTQKTLPNQSGNKNYIFYLWQKDRRLALGMALGFIVALVLLGFSWWRVFTKPAPTAKSVLSESFEMFMTGLNSDQSFSNITPNQNLPKE